MTIALSADRFGGGSLGSKASRGWKPKPPRADVPVQHPVYGKHKMTTRRELAGEAKKHREFQRGLDRKYEKLASEKTAKANAKIRKQWDAHLKEQSQSRSFKW